MKATVFLRNEHKNLRSLFKKYNKLSTWNAGGRKELFNEIRREILAHSQMEIEIFYPALSNTSSVRMADFVSAAVEDHHGMEKMLGELDGISSSDRVFKTKMADLIGQVLRHIEKEEKEIFEEARNNLTEHRLEELGLEMEDYRKILMELVA